MLSRVAERLYWMARTLERAENTARLVQATSQLLLGSAPGSAFDWSDLTRIMGLENLPVGRPDQEREVVNLLTVEDSNPGALLVCLAQARENARTLREVLPREAWVAINELFLNARRDLRPDLSAVERDRVLRAVIRHRLGVTGLLAETMSHDAAHQFIRLGEMIERADMTSRILDLTTAMKPGSVGATAVWLHVLEALSADQMYRRHVAMQITPAGVRAFLFADNRFPRALRYALEVMETALTTLPDPQEPLRALRAAERLLAPAVDLDDPLQLRNHLDAIQIHLGGIHAAITERYFHPAPIRTGTAALHAAAQQ